MEKVKCDLCGKEVYRSPYDIRTYKLHFCCKDHFMKYRKENSYYAHDQDKSSLNKIKKLAKLRKEKYGLEKS